MLEHQYLASLVLVFFLLAIVAPLVTNAYGHGIGLDQSLPTIIGNRSVAISTSLSPDFIESSGQPQLVIRTFDAGNNSTIRGIDYRIAVQFRNETLLNQRFESSDGIIVANLQSDKNISGWQIAGKESATPDDPIQVSQSNPVTIKSKFFSEGGLYHILVTLEKLSPGLSMDSDRTFDLYVTIGKTFTFDNIETAEGKVSMSTRTYYDEIMKFGYYSINQSISFSMPFTWEPSYVAQVPVVHVEVQIPKSAKELQANSYKGTINGRDLDSRALIIDDYTVAGSRIVHFLLTNDMLRSLSEQIKGNVATFTISPVEKPKFPMDIMSNDNKYVFELSWGPDIIETGSPTTFVMNLQDANGNLLSGSSFDFVLAQDGKEIHRQHLTSGTGDYSTQYTFTKTGTVILSADNINGVGQPASAKINLIVRQGSNNATLQPLQQQPSGCLIATAAFGSELSPQVQYLRNFRDHYILSTASGSAFMSAFNSIYYSFSPQVADFERGQPWLQMSVKAGLYPLFGILMTAERTYAVVAGDSGSVLAGAAASSLIGAVYLWPAGLAFAKKLNTMTLIVTAGGATAALLITLVTTPAFLPITTSAFVIAIAGTSAIAVAKGIRRAFKVK